LIAAKATFALNAAVWFLRGRLLIRSPLHSHLKAAGEQNFHLNPCPNLRYRLSLPAPNCDDFVFAFPISERLIRELQHGLDADERQFLISFVRNQPNWGLLGIPHLAELPGIRWKLHNLGQLAKFRPKKFLSQAEALERLLGS
jgi:hypothetical protein